jgi:hypothetical protein
MRMMDATGMYRMLSPRAIFFLEQGDEDRALTLALGRQFAV